MKQKMKTQKRATPGAVASEQDILEWRSLPRDEQLVRMRETLLDAVQSGVSARSMSDIKTDALKRLQRNEDG